MRDLMVSIHSKTLWALLSGIQELSAISDYDALTNIKNRRGLSKALQAMGDDDAGEAIALMIDIDHFKRINDTYGHAAGDECLRQVAERIQQSVRTTRHDDVLYRYGGEEFAAILQGSDEPTAHQVAERIRQKVAGQPFQLPGGESIHITVSVGVGQDLVEADQALYAAKRNGRNQVVCSCHARLDDLKQQQNALWPA